MIKQLARGPLGVSAVALALLAAAPATADDMAAFFKDRTVTILHGFGAGGTYGLYATALAHFMARHVPGKPTIIVQAMPGAGGIKASNYAYNVMPKEGLNWFMPADALVISNLLESDKTKYDASKFYFLGTSTQTNAVLVVRTDAKINSIEDLTRREVIVSSSGTGSQTYQVPAMMNGVFGTKFKIVTGYKGSNDVQLAIERGEAEASSLTWTAWSTGKPHWFKDGFAKPLLQVGMEKDPRLPNVPMAVDLASGADNRKIVEFISSMGPLGRGLALPPGAPKDRGEALRKAFDATMADKAIHAEAKAKNFDLNPMKGADLQKLVESMMQISPALVTRARDIIMPKGKS